MSQIRFCEQCGNQVMEGERFCVSCGAPLGITVNQASNADSFQQNPYWGDAGSGLQGNHAMTSYSAVHEPEGSAYQGGNKDSQEKGGGLLAFFRRKKKSNHANEVAGFSESNGQGYSQTSQSALGMGGDEEYLTTMLDQTEFDDDPPTTVLGNADIIYLVRDATGDRIDFEEPVVLGKGKAATCRIGGNSAISRQHARLFMESGDYYLDDLGSTNGTVVGAEKLSPGKPCLIKDGFAFQLADERFTFHVES